MVTLREAINLSMVADNENVYISYAEYCEDEPQAYTVAELRKVFDIDKVNVLHITPTFESGEYSEYRGIEFELE